MVIQDKAFSLLWEQQTPADMMRTLAIPPSDLAAAALVRLWHEQELGAEDPILFYSDLHNRPYHHQPVMLKLFQDSEYGQRCQFVKWEMLAAPAYAHGLAATPLARLKQNDRTGDAHNWSRGTVLGPLIGWMRYDFAEWSALAVLLTTESLAREGALVAVPDGRQDDWLAFRDGLFQAHCAQLHSESSGRIEFLGEGRSIDGTTLRNARFEDIILPSEVLELVAQQRLIWQPEMLARYSRLKLPRVRRVLLYGPPGTGKTSLFKAEAARHLQNGGVVFYVTTSKKPGESWECVEDALVQAAHTRLPALILVEDFEQFVTVQEDFQRILNVLDGAQSSAIDNPAGTLLLASSNDPEQINPRIKDRPGRIDVLIKIGAIEQEDLVLRFLRRFLGDGYRDEHAASAPALLGQTGSHIQQVCFQAGIKALTAGAETVSVEDLLAAHEMLLEGREKAAGPDSCDAPLKIKRQGGMGFGGKK